MIFIIYGSNSLLMQRRLEEIKNKYIREVDPSGLNISVLDQETPLLKIAQEIKSAPFLARRRLIILKNISHSKDKSAKDFLHDLTNDETAKSDSIIVIWESSDDKKKIVELKKIFEKSRYAHFYGDFTGSEAMAFIAKEAKNLNKEITSSAAQLLFNLVGTDSYALRNETVKLSAYCSKEITERDIKLLTIGEDELNIFDLTDSLAENKKTVGLNLLEIYLLKSKDGLSLLGMLIKQLIRLIMIKDMAIITPGELEKKLNIHPFVIKKSIQQAKLFDLEKLIELHSQLLKMEKLFKSTSLDQKIIFDQYLAKI